MKILLVEDHAALAEISCSQLREMYDHEVVHALSGAAALRAMEVARPDLVLLDLNLPDMSGYDLAARLRKDANWNETIVVALTGFGNVIDNERAHDVGIDAHFRKPMDFELLPSIKRAAANL